MQTALYDPQHGYYTTRVPGHGASYRTSPLLTSVYGELIAVALGRMWDAMEGPDPFTVIEVGPGSGDLAVAAGASLPASMKAATTWCLVEQFASIRGLQQERLSDSSVRAEWVAALEECRAGAGCILANEVVDNFPVHLFEVTPAGPQEIYLNVDGDRLVENLGPSSVGELSLLEEAAAHLEEGDRFEVRPQVDEWCRQASAVLERGYVLVVDYGDTTPRLWTARPSGTLLAYRDGAISFDPLEVPGETDITAHVDFSALRDAARSAGFKPQALLTQREFLKSLGMEESTEELRQAQKEAEAAGLHAEAVALLAERGRRHALVARGGLGDFLVFLAAKNAPPLDIEGGATHRIFQVFQIL